MLKKIIILVLLIALLVILLPFQKKAVPKQNPTPSKSVQVASSPDLSMETLLKSTLRIPNEGIFIELKGGAYDVDPLTVDLLPDTESYAVSDFNGDDQKDIFAVTVENSGGTGHFYRLLAFKNDTGVPMYAGEIFLGDRIQINKISAIGNKVTVDIITQGPDEGLCCGTLRQVKTYTFDGATFKEIVE